MKKYTSRATKWLIVVSLICGVVLLTGIILALLAQGYQPENAARLGVYVHGLAGDIACRRMGEISLTASDIIDALPEAWKVLSEIK